MRRTLSALAVVSVLLGACTGSEPVTAPAPEPTTTTAAPTEPPPPPIAPLIGMELDDPLDRPVLAVKIDNASAALPPVGLEAADIVFEEEVEGGITRLLALFHADDPGEVGPVRSAREVDADLLPPFQAALAMSGAAKVVDRLMAKAELKVLEDEHLPDGYFRADDRIAPHNLIGRTEVLWEEADDVERLDEPAFAFDETVPGKGKSTGTARVEFSVHADAQWTWNRGRKVWERLQNGAPHATADGNPITADNVVLMRITTAPGNRTDSAGTPTLALDVIGKGRAVVLRDGQRFNGRWSKPSAQDPIEWRDRKGDPLPLRPGTTWIELVDVKEQVAFSKKATRPAD